MAGKLPVKHQQQIVVPMKKITKGNSVAAGSTIGKLLTSSQRLGMLAVATALLPVSAVLAGEVDLTTTTSGTIDGSVGGTAVYTTADTQPAGTGVFKPFLTLQNSPIEQGYNTSGDDVLDTKRVDQWNLDMRVGDLQIVHDPKNGVDSFAFELDANETGQGNINRLLSIDNIRIYTSAIGAQTESDPDKLGELRFAQNDPLKNLDGTYNIANWVKIDASNSDAPPGGGGSTSGSGSSDMLVYIPTSAFHIGEAGGASLDDYLYFYNLNGVHYSTEAGTSSDAGFEEWRAWTGPNAVPDGGNTLILLGSGLAALGFLAKRGRLARVA